MSGDKLNGILEDISADIGYTATTLLVDWFGGRSLYVPEAATDVDHAICKVIGEPCYKRLVQHYGGQTLNLPLDYRRERTRRNRLIGALITKGLGNKDIAKIALLTEQQIKHIRIELEQTGILPYILHPGATIQEVEPDTRLAAHVADMDELLNTVIAEEEIPSIVSLAAAVLAFKNRLMRLNRAASTASQQVALFTVTAEVLCDDQHRGNKDQA